MTEIFYKNKSIVAFSDTHGKHRKLPYIPADIVIFLGDACNFGNNTQLHDFLEWFSYYPAKHKLFIAGNHELQWLYQPNDFFQAFPKNIIFLDNRVIALEEINFVTVPARIELVKQPKLKLPNKVDFLLTHAPPKGILDSDMGCSNLLKYVLKVQPCYHLFGHIHECRGSTILNNNTHFVNVSI